MIREYEVLISLIRVVTLKLAMVFFLHKSIKFKFSPSKLKYLLKVVKKDLSPDWEDASVKLPDVEVGIFIPRPHHSVSRLAEF